MKGLLIKDMKLMKNMRNSIVMILLIAVGMGSYLKDGSFLIVYLSLIGATFTTSTLSYDEFDNGYSFLFSLPVTRKSYVKEKYCFGLLLSGGGWLLGTGIAGAAGVARNMASLTDSIVMALMMIPIPLILLAVLLPLHFKFGGEKSRIVMVGIMGGLFAIVMAAAKILEMLHLDLGALENLQLKGMGAAAAAGAGIGVVLLLLSCRISMGIMEKKEF